jgi:hypothetical protein
VVAANDPLIKRQFRAKSAFLLDYGARLDTNLIDVKPGRIEIQ